jgi:HD-GYP domain-containing protein (c-di-GMP phosphodiesterase class II)
MRRGGDDAALWRGMLDVLWKEAEYEQRLDSVLGYVSEVSELPSCHLYLVDEEGQRLHLERSQTATRAPAPLAPQDLDEPFLSDRGEAGGGAQTASPGPPLELELDGELERERFVTTPVGTLYSVPLRHNGTLVGLLQAGPTGDGSLPGRAQKRLESLRFPLTVVVEQARAEELLRRKLATVSARVAVGRKLQGSALELERFVGLLLTLALRATRTEAGFVAIADMEAGVARIRAQINMPEGFADEVDLTPDRGLFDWSAAEGGALVLRDLDTAARLGIRAVVAVPLHGEDDAPLGIFALVDLGSGISIDEHSLELLGSYAEQVRLMLANDRLFHTFSDQYLATLKGLASSLDARRPYTQGHHAQVSAAAAALARELDLAEDEVEAVAVAGEIHDVGLAGVAEGEGAYQADVEHPTVGADLVEHLPLHPSVAIAVATHHEWIDGWGFPRGLKGDEIPPAGRILAAAEFLVEMGSGDPVRRPLPPERLAEELERRRGSQFDPQVVDAALALIERGGLP